MDALAYTILERPNESPSGLAGIGEFVLQPSGKISAERILMDPTITLFSLDLDERRAVFVETPPDLDLSTVPFLYTTQFEQATCVLTLSFDDMIELAEAVEIDDGRLVFIHSVGRAGSTLASQLFAQVEGAVSLSEPESLTWLVAARYGKKESEAYLKQLLNATICLLCKTPARTVWAIKGRSFWIELGDWLYELFPQARNIFLYRDAESWLGSGMHAYFDELPDTEEELAAGVAELRDWLAPLVPLLDQYDDGYPLSVAGLLVFMWLGVMDRYLALSEAGIEMLPIRFERWQTAPRATAEAMLHYGRVHPADNRALDETLKRDAQAGSKLARSKVSKHSVSVQPQDLEDLHYYLSRHPVIKTADFLVPEME